MVNIWLSSFSPYFRKFLQGTHFSKFLKYWENEESHAFTIDNTNGIKKRSQFRESHLALKSKILHSSLITKCSFTSMERETIIWCAVERPTLRQAFQYLQRYYITHRKLSRAIWSQKSFWKIDESQKFRESHLALKSKILHSSLMMKYDYTSTHRMALTRCVLKISNPVHFLKHLWCYHITQGKFSRAS